VVSKWLKLGVALACAVALALAVYSALTKPSAALGVPLAGAGLAAAKKRPELAALLALLSLSTALPTVNLLDPLGPLRPMPKPEG